MVLFDLKQGESATIKDLSSLNQLVKTRLMNLGIYLGSEVNIKSKMPLGGPCVIECNGQRVGIRSQEAKSIRVEIK
ncbi:FeoA family protein [Bacillus andreraoultii]|uniref:FeoA family protein n=1 Tax=Bacillus andreraoultii TaxID=1499685 RepID=UPI00053A3FE6|nr:FeoA family protein [Bacillus andreraoultii]